MWKLAAFALVSAPVQQQSVTVDGEAFGVQQAMTCTWFTNFENSLFVQCDGAAGQLFSEQEQASVKCVGKLCEQLDAAARKTSGQSDPWGTFKVKLLGRIALKPHPKRHLGDGNRTVLVEAVQSVTPIRLQP